MKHPVMSSSKDPENRSKKTCCCGGHNLKNHKKNKLAKKKSLALRLARLLKGSEMFIQIVIEALITIFLFSILLKVTLKFFPQVEMKEEIRLRLKLEELRKKKQLYQDINEEIEVTAELDNFDKKIDKVKTKLLVYEERRNK